MSDFQQNTSNSSTSNPGLEDSSFDPTFDGKTTANKVYEVVIALSSFVNGMRREYEEERDEVSKSIEGHKRELANVRTDNTKSLAVFVAFFTFVSISFSILPRISQPLVLIGIMFVLLGSLAFFILLLAWILDVQRDKWFTNKQLIVGVLAIALFVTGLFSAHIGYQDMKNNDFYTQNEVDDLLLLQEEFLNTQIQSSEKYTDEVLTRFKVCVATRGLGSCLVE